MLPEAMVGWGGKPVFRASGKMEQELAGRGIWDHNLLPSQPSSAQQHRAGQAQAELREYREPHPPQSACSMLAIRTRNGARGQSYAALDSKILF